jgi:hypothetical protein
MIVCIFEHVQRRWTRNDSPRAARPIRHGEERRTGPDEYTVTAVTSEARGLEELREMDLPIPDTALGKAFKRGRPVPQRPGPEHADAEQSVALRKLKQALKAADTDKDGCVSRRELEKMFMEGASSAAAQGVAALRVFGADDVASALKALDKNEDGKISMAEVDDFIEAQGDETLARTFARFREKAPERTSVTGVRGLMGNLYSGLSKVAGQLHVEFADIARTVPIETGYVVRIPPPDTQLTQSPDCTVSCR